MIAKLLVLHFLADFLLQPREMATKKSIDPHWLFAHLVIQFGVFCVVGWKFALANAAIHGVIDWNIWRLYKLSVAKRFPEFNWKDPKQASTYDYWNDSWFYHTIGLDQLLHGLTLVLLAGALL